MEAFVCQQFIAACIFYAAYHITGVIEADDSTVGNRNIVATAIDIVDGAAQQLKVRLANLWLHHVFVGSIGNGHVIHAVTLSCGIDIVTVATSKELTYVCLLILLVRDAYKDVP